MNLSRYEHSAELGWKADTEGGLAELIFGRGLQMEDLPNDMPPHLRAFVRHLNLVKPYLEEVEKYLREAVDSYEYAAWETADG